LGISVQPDSGEFGYDWTATPLANQPGTIVAPDPASREPALPGTVVPLRPHFGTMGVAHAAPVGSAPVAGCTTPSRCPVRYSPSATHMSRKAMVKSAALHGSRHRTGCGA
jgi:hypothetical protein